MLNYQGRIERVQVSLTTCKSESLLRLRGEKEMTAIIEACGKQYRVQPGDTLFVEKLGEEDGAKVTFDKVLAVVNDDGSAVIGKPVVDGATVTATVVKTGKSKKIIVYKMHPKKNYRRKQGHRQPYTKLTIDSVNA